MAEPALNTAAQNRPRLPNVSRPDPGARYSGPCPHQLVGAQTTQI
jgi:hypothetical protein